MADAIPPILIELQLETAKIAAQMQEITGKFSEFGETVKKQGGFLEQLKNTAAGVFGGNLLTTGLNAISGAMQGAIADSQEYEKLLGQTKAVIESTGNAAGISVEGLKQHASQLEGIAAVDENVILHGENVIATFTNIRNAAGAGNDIFDQTTKAALDLSSALGQDMQSSAIQLGKALNDPIKGISALQRVGVTFTEAQKKQIAVMQNSGDTMGAQKVILAEVNREFGGAAKAAGDTFAGAVFRAKDKVADFGRDLVTKLQPILLTIGKTIFNIYNDTLKPLFTWIGKNKEAVALFVGVLATAYATFKAYQLIMIAIRTAQEFYIVSLALMKGAQLADVVATEAQTGAHRLLNAVINANPMAKIIALLALLAAGFVYAWNHSKTFRDIVVDVAKVGIIGIGYLIDWVGKLAKGILVIVTGPAHLLLKALSALGFGPAKTALKELNGALDTVGKFFDDASKKVKGYADNLDALRNKKISLPSFGKAPTATDITTGVIVPDAGESAAEIKAKIAAAKKAAAEKLKVIKEAAKEALKASNQATKDSVKEIQDANKAMEQEYKAHAEAVKAANKEVVSIYDKMNAAIEEGSKKANEALKKRDKENADTRKKYADLEVKINEKKNQELKKNTEEWNKAYDKAYENAAKRNAAIDIEYTKKKKELYKSTNEKIATAEQDAVEKRASIIQSSVDRLRNAFASAVGGANITEMFKAGATSAEAMIEQLKTKLKAAKELQSKAAALQAAGYSQVFIEEVIKNGPEVGTQMANALLGASAETQTQLQSLYAEVNTTSEHGLDTLAQTMNAGGHLATEELMTSYSNVSVELKKTLDKINTDLLENLATAEADYKDKLAEVESALNEALASADERLAEANKATNADFKEALKTNAAELVDALAQIQSDYESKIADISASTKEKLDSLNDDLNAVINTLKTLNDWKDATNATTNNPSLTFTPFVPAPNANPYTTTPTMGTTQGPVAITNNYNVTGINMTNPFTAAKVIDNMVQFGSSQAVPTAVNTVGVK